MCSHSISDDTAVLVISLCFPLEKRKTEKLFYSKNSWSWWILFEPDFISGFTQVKWRGHFKNETWEKLLSRAGINYNWRYLGKIWMKNNGMLMLTIFHQTGSYQIKYPSPAGIKDTEVFSFLKVVSRSRNTWLIDW